MVTSIGQHTPVFLPGEAPDREDRRPQSTGSQRVGNDLSDPACIDTRLFFACGSSSPVRVECEGGAAAWVTGTRVVPSVQGHRLPQPLEL